MRFTRFPEHLLYRLAERVPVHAAGALNELARREHENLRRRLLNRLHTCPIPAGEIREGDVLSEHCGRMRLHVTAVHTLTASGRVLITGKYLRLDNGTPFGDTVELPLLDQADTTLNLVTHNVTDLQPYEVIADDQLLDRLGSAVPGQPTSDLDAALLQARDTVEADPFPHLVDIDTAITVIRGAAA